MSKKAHLLWALALTAVLVMGADLKEKTGMTLLSSTVVTIGTNGQALNQQTLYTVPPTKNGIVEYIILREPSGTLDGCTDVNFGIGDGTTGTWIDAEAGIGDMTQADDYMVFERTTDAAHISNEFSVIDGDDTTATNRIFGIHVEAGATAAAATVTIDVFGYIF